VEAIQQCPTEVTKKTFSNFEPVTRSNFCRAIRNILSWLAYLFMEFLSSLLQPSKLWLTKFSCCNWTKKVKVFIRHWNQTYFLTMFGAIWKTLGIVTWVQKVYWIRFVMICRIIKVEVGEIYGNAKRTSTFCIFVSFYFSCIVKIPLVLQLHTAGSN